MSPGVLLLATPAEVAEARERAREMFTHRLRSGGLMVVPVVLERWWPRVARVLATARCEHCNQGLARVEYPVASGEVAWVHEVTGKKACEPWTIATPRQDTIEEEGAQA